MRSAAELPLKSGIRTSIEVSGSRRRISAMHAAKDLRRRRGQIVTIDTRDHDVAQPHLRHRLGEPDGLAASRAAGVPWATAQYAQFLVHTSPRIMNVAALCSQHSPMLDSALPRRPCAA